jgi:hypothetical protein
MALFLIFSEEIECLEAIEVVSYKIGVCKVSKDGKDCRTTFKKVCSNGKTSVVLAKPHTGRMHQIRVHLQYLGKYKGYVRARVIYSVRVVLLLTLRTLHIVLPDLIFLFILHLSFSSFSVDELSSLQQLSVSGRYLKWPL